MCWLLAAKSNVAELDIVNDYLNGKSNVHAASLAKYKDDLFNKKVSIFIAVGDEGCFVRENVSDGNNMQLAIVDNLLDCVVSANDDNYILNGVNKNGSMNVIMIGEDFTENQFVAFVNKIYQATAVCLCILSCAKHYLCFRKKEIFRSVISYILHYQKSAKVMQKSEIILIGLFR